ncbi:unnamed protein product, partial [Symbiodinium microadriaticum]
RVRRKTAASPESAKEILSIYGLNRGDAEKEILDPDVPADQAGDDDDFGVIHDSQSEIETSSEAEEPAAAKTTGRAKKAYFDPAVGCYIRLKPDGQEVPGELSEGHEGFCMVRFPSEMPFQSEALIRSMDEQNPGLMAPQSKTGKGPQSKMAKAMAAKSKAQQAKVKTEKATPKRKAKAAKVEVEQEEGEPMVPTSLGYARGSISAALTGLRYQLKAKKTSEEDKEEYESGDITTKRMILAKVQQYGVKQCNWGIDETGLDEDVKKELVEELLTEAEKRYNYERSTKLHPKYDVLSKYFYMHSAGQVARQATKTEESLGSQCAGMKNLQLKDKRSLDIMLGKNSGSSSSKDPALQPSESFARAKELLKKIVAEKKKLTQSNEELKSLKTKISTKHSGDKAWDNRTEDVDQAIAALEDFLGVLRQHEAESVPADVTSDCTELVATFHSVVDQAASHDKGSK